MKIVLTHDWLRVNAGSEKVIQSMVSVFHAEIVGLYTLFNKLPVPDQKQILQGIQVHTSFLQWIPSITNAYKFLMPVFPWIVGHTQLPEADLYLSSSHAVAKGYRKKKGSVHICYCHTPMRYAWYLKEDYLNGMHGLKKWIANQIIRRIRQWDFENSKQVDYFIANSIHIQQQILNTYQRVADVIYPPVQTDKFLLNPHPRQSFYLAPGRFVSFKKIDLIIEAFKRRPQLKLVLIGDGYDSDKCKKMLANTPNIIWLGYQHDDELILYMQQAKACVFASKEDFGIMCVEAQSTGTPVIALRYGGHIETVIEGETGYFFDHQDADSLLTAIDQMESAPLTNHASIRSNALRFSESIFQKEIEVFVQKKMQDHVQKGL